MSTMPNEPQEQLDHEARLREDKDYAIQCRTESIFNDLKEFEEFMFDGYEASRLIARELLRALYIQRYNNKPDAANYAMDALSNINDALDAKIEQIVESER